MNSDERSSDNFASSGAGRVPVTVSITRRVDPGDIAEATSWVQKGINLASGYPGFLGSGWVRASADSHEWHLLYRFSDVTLLDEWEASDDRAGWLFEGRELVEVARVDKRTGIEGWFDAPQPEEVDAKGPTAPPRWKQAVIIGLGFYPANLAFTLLVIAVVPGWRSLWPLLTVFVSTLVLTPIMTYWVLPFITRMLRPWLHRS
ncbi:hypothetical protein GCM10022381_03480 [Leifsonia kafniensis]|uniref:Antibiotic biosynthesis monooxygenase n=1 Tax=Leifsonia kafniensis TaxID=475957 RepID=A0ABP7K1U4_9MICO